MSEYRSDGKRYERFSELALTVKGLRAYSDDHAGEFPANPLFIHAEDLILGSPTDEHGKVLGQGRFVVPREYVNVTSVKYVNLWNSDEYYPYWWKDGEYWVLGLDTAIGVFIQDPTGLQRRGTERQTVVRHVGIYNGDLRLFTLDDKTDEDVGAMLDALDAREQAR